MIKFEKDNYTMYFKTAEEAAQWLVDEWESESEFASILENEFFTFGYWLNNHYNVIVRYTYEELYKEYMEELASDIYHDYIYYFERVEDEE